jgi:uncharacterized membrane protein YhaH (DUF805 family)
LDWPDLFLSFDGRIGRTKFWLGAAIGIALFCLGLVSIGLIGYYGMLVALLLFLSAASVFVPIGIKRLHDRDRSGKWLLVFYALPVFLEWASGVSRSFLPSGMFALAALTVAAWSLVELGLLRGSEGPNRYGPDPDGTPDWRTAYAFEDTGRSRRPAQQVRSVSWSFGSARRIPGRGVMEKTPDPHFRHDAVWKEHGP